MPNEREFVQETANSGNAAERERERGIADGDRCPEPKSVIGSSECNLINTVQEGLHLVDQSGTQVNRGGQQDAAILASHAQTSEQHRSAVCLVNLCQMPDEYCPTIPIQTPYEMLMWWITIHR